MLRYRPRPTTRRIILHDAHTPASMGDVTPHLLVNGRIMGLLDIGYHYVIERDGKVFTTRDPESVGSHLRRHNLDSVGICLAGGGKGAEEFTSAQVASLSGLYTIIGRQFPVVGHYEVTRSGNCPCMDMDLLRREIGCHE